MDPTLKQRLVGTAVLVALAVIFVPMLLDGPVERESERRVTGVPLELPEPVRPRPDSRPEGRSHEVANAEEPRPRASDPRASDPTVANADPPTIGYAVQLGAFSEEARADALAERVSGLGFPTFVQRVTLANGTLYRVRVGPFAERSDAEAQLARIARASGERAVVVEHP